VDKQVEIEKTMLDGRYAERHTSYVANSESCPSGTIVEIFAEEKRPLHLEKRIIQTHKNIVSEERIEYIKDGEIVEVEVKSLDPTANATMQIKEHIGIADHAKFIDGEYVTKKELGPVISDAVVAGIASLLENVEVVQQKIEPSQFTAQKQIAERMEQKKGNDTVVNMVLLCLIICQLAFGFWVFFM
jgi:hypothetical protein